MPTFRLHRALAASLLAAGMLAAPGIGEAGKPCVGYEVSSPGGSNSNTICSPVSDPFTSYILSKRCMGAPPINTEACVITVIYVP